MTCPPLSNQAHLSKASDQCLSLHPDRTRPGPEIPFTCAKFHGDLPGKIPFPLSKINCRCFFPPRGPHCFFFFFWFNNLYSGARTQSA
jgi:hypothetical protein